MISTLLIFSFQVCLAPLVLHSFPTRRSSDLRRLLFDAHLEAVFRWNELDGFFEARRRIEIRRQDRKSTRLNSSHSQISYAVFCLKKKNKIQYDRLHFSLIRRHIETA